MSNKIYKCGKCGHELYPPDVTRCPYCGVPLKPRKKITAKNKYFWSSSLCLGVIFIIPVMIVVTPIFTDYMTQPVLILDIAIAMLSGFLIIWILSKRFDIYE